MRSDHRQAQAGRKLRAGLGHVPGRSRPAQRRSASAENQGLQVHPAPVPAAGPTGRSGSPCVAGAHGDDGVRAAGRVRQSGAPAALPRDGAAAGTRDSRGARRQPRPAHAATHHGSHRADRRRGHRRPGRGAVDGASGRHRAAGAARRAAVLGAGLAGSGVRARSGGRYGHCLRRSSRVADRPHAAGSGFDPDPTGIARFGREPHARRSDRPAGRAHRDAGRRVFQHGPQLPEVDGNRPGLPHKPRSHDERRASEDAGPYRPVRPRRRSNGCGRFPAWSPPAQPPTCRWSLPRSRKAPISGWTRASRDGVPA